MSNKKTTTKGDIILLLFLVVCSFSLFFIFSLNLNNEDGEKLVKIQVDGKVQAILRLKDYKKDSSYVINSKYGKNTIVFTGKGIKMVESNCRDKICIKEGEITRIGESIICLPNRLIITLIGPTDKGVDAVANAS